MRLAALRLLAIPGLAVVVAATAAAPANAARDRTTPARSASRNATVVAKASSKTSRGGALTAAHRARVRGHVSIGHGYRPYHRSYVRFGWPYYYGLYGHYGWPHYRYPQPYPTEVYGDDDAKRPGAVETDVRPGRAEIRVDGELAGQARDFNGNWDVLWLSPGAHELEFSRDGYQALKIRVDVHGSSYYRIRQRLNKGSGVDPRSLELAAAPDLLRDEDRPERVEPRYRVPENPPESSRPGDRQPALTRGFLTIEATPADAAVYLDGKFLASAGELSRLHGALPVAQGEHTVEVVRPGYRSVTKRITVTESDPATVSIRLQRNGGDT